MAHSARIRRKDLKRPDEFITVTTQVLAWGRTHQQTLIWAGAGLVAAILAASAVVGVRHARDRDANFDLGRALAAYRDAKATDAAGQLSDVGRRWSSTSAGTVAKLLAAEAELRRDNADSAIVALQEVIALPSLPEYLRQQALVAYGFALEKKNQPTEATAKYAEAAAVDGPYTAQALLAQARLQTVLRENDKARALYERIKKDFPDVAEREQIGEKLGHD